MCLPKPLRSKFEFGCMRIKCQWRVSIFLALSFCLSAATAAEAQSFFQTLFGNLFKSAPAEKAPRSVPSITFSPRNQGSHFRGPSWGGNYRTVCVRTCDGYYFPISASASRARFSKDSEACEARCGGARLYYLPKHSEDTASMIDLTGRRYDQLDNAFVYRKKLIDGCSCRPMPWSAAERARHNRYAYEREILRQSEERDRKLREQAVALARPPARDDNSPVPAPEPKYIALAGLSERNRLSEVSATNAGAAPAVTGPGEGNRRHAAYIATIKAAISQSSGADGSAGIEAASVVLSARDEAAPSARAASARRRSRRTRRVSSPAFGWSLAGGSSYAWPGDR